MINNLEFVCSGNNGRSKLAEIVAVDYALLRKIYLSICSSGTMVELPEDLSQFKGYIETAVNKKILGTEYLDNFDSNPRGALDELIKREAENRNRYLTTELHITPSSQSRTQIRARPDAELILPIGAKNLLKVKDLYSGSNYTPQIVGLEEFSGAGSLEDVFPSTYDEYRVLASKVHDSTIIAINRIASMH
jgi:hypothetical protein